jgi:uroporphyrinogen-III synthase
MADADLASSRSKINVWVTRPTGPGELLTGKLGALGFSSVSEPLIELSPVLKLDPLQCQHLINLDNYQHIIFVSTNAVCWGMESIEKYWTQMPEGLSWHAIGAATSRALHQYGVDVLAGHSAMNSEELLGSDSLQQVSGAKVLIVKGVGGRTLIGECLYERGAMVDTLEVYRRLKPQLEPVTISNIYSKLGVNVTLISSGEGLVNLLSLLERKVLKQVLTLPIIVPGERVARQARGAGFSNVLVAKNATDQSMIDKLCVWAGGST